MQHVAKIEWKGKMHFEAHSKGGTVPLDGDPEFGGQNKGLSPKPLILDALGGCMGMDMASLIPKMRADKDLTTFQIEVTGELTDEHPKYYKSINIAITFIGQNFKKDKLEKAVNLSIERYCGVYHMLKSFADIQTAIIYKSN